MQVLDRPASPAAAAPTTRERLLDSAARVIARDGYHRARLVDVARDAGLTTGAVYSNFRDKEELFLAAFERIQGLNDSLFEVATGDLDGLVAGYQEAAERLESSPDLQVLTFELALLAARNQRVHDLLESGMRESVAAVAERLPDTGGSVEDRMATAALVVGLGNGIALVRMFAPDLVPVESIGGALRRLATATPG